MIVYPAIDIMDGEVVRLVEGDFEQKTVFAKDPFVLLKSFVEAGATCAHLVDLSGAKDPLKRQTELFKSLLSELNLKIQIGGGVRTLEQIDELINAGVDRVVIGSLAVKNPQIVIAALKKWGPDRLALALDVRLQNQKAIVMTEGWTESSGRTFQEVLEPFMMLGLQRVLCTDIAVDGRPVGPNVELYKTLLAEYPNLELQASGGVSQLKDFTALKETGVQSVVVGRALLTGAFTLQEALSYAE